MTLSDSFYSVFTIAFFIAIMAFWAHVSIQKEDCDKGIQQACEWVGR